MKAKSKKQRENEKIRPNTPHAPLHEEEKTMVLTTIASGIKMGGIKLPGKHDFRSVTDRKSKERDPIEKGRSQR